MIITQLFTHKKLNEFAPGDYYGGGDSGGGDSGGGNVFQLTNEELVKLLNSVRPGLGNKWLTDVDQKRFNQLARRDQDRAIFEFDSWLEDLGISTGFMITDIHVNDGKKIWHGFFRNINEQGIAEGSAANDYFTRRKSEEDRIAGVKAPAKNKKNPANTDYAKKRKQQDVTEVESTVAENYEAFKKGIASSRAEHIKLYHELVALRAKKDAAKKDATKKKEPKKQGVAEALTYPQKHSSWSVHSPKKNEFNTQYKLDQEKEARAHAERIGGKLVKVDQRGHAVRANKGVAEGYSLKKTNVNKYMEPGDPDEYTQDINIKDTDYEIINNKTGQVVGTASWTTNDYFGPGALKITMKNGATRWLDIWEREKGNPQTAFNRFVKDPKTAKKYKEQGVAEGSIGDKIKGAAKSVKRATQGWGIGAAPDMITPTGVVSAFKDMDGQRLANFVASRKEYPKPRKDSAGAFADKVIDREMKQRGYGRVADKDEQGVAEGDTLMNKLQEAMVKEGRVKELADDLKTLSDAEFIKKYGKAKAAIRKDMKKLDEQVVAEGKYDSTKPFGVRYKVFAGREGRLTTKEYWTTSSEKLEKAVAKIEALDNFYEIDGYNYPNDQQGVAEASDTMQRYGQKILKRAKAAKSVEPELKKEPQAPSDNSSISTRDLMQQLRKPKKQGVAEGSEQVYKVVAVNKSNALKKPTKLTVKAGSIEEVFERLAANDWYPLEINGVEVINGKRLKQGVAEGSLGTALLWPEVVNKVSGAMKAMGWKGTRKADGTFMFSTRGQETDDQYYIVIIDNAGERFFTYALGTIEEGDPRIGEQESLPNTEASVSELMNAIRDGFGLSEQGVAEGSEQEYKIYFNFPGYSNDEEATIVIANSPEEAAQKFKDETPEAKIKDIIPLGQDGFGKQGVAEGKPQKKADRFHINKDGKPATLASYADKDSAVKDRDAKYPDAKVHQVGPRGKVKGEFEEGVAEGSEDQGTKMNKTCSRCGGSLFRFPNTIKCHKCNQTWKASPKNKEQGVAEGYPKHQDLSGISTDKLKAYLDKQSKQQVSGEGNQVKRVRAELQRREQSLSENAEDLHIGDPVIITGNGVEFEGATGEIIDFGRDHRFVVVDLYNHGKHSFHSSDVSFNEYAGSDDEEARMYDAGEFGDDPRDDLDEARMSAALRMANAVDKQRAKSDASLRRTPGSIPKKEEPKKVPADSGAKTVSEHRVNRQALMAKMLNSR